MRAPPRPAHGWKAEVETRRSRPPAAVGACARGQTRMRRARCAVRGSQIAQAADTAASRMSFSRRDLQASQYENKLYMPSDR